MPTRSPPCAKSTSPPATTRWLPSTCTGRWRCTVAKRVARKHPEGAGADGPPVADLLPDRLSLPKVRSAAAGCEACHLHRNATQTVFGEGPSKADVMMVGEQPGDAEDLAGHPFVGPAGKLLERALEEAASDRRLVSVTNVGTRLKWGPRGKRR